MHALTIIKQLSSYINFIPWAWWNVCTHITDSVNIRNMFPILFPFSKKDTFAIPFFNKWDCIKNIAILILTQVIRVWFCNRRQKEKRINPPSSSFNMTHQLQQLVNTAPRGVSIPSSDGETSRQEEIKPQPTNMQILHGLAQSGLMLSSDVQQENNLESNILNQQSKIHLQLQQKSSTSATNSSSDGLASPVKPCQRGGDPILSDSSRGIPSEATIKQFHLVPGSPSSTSNSASGPHDLSSLNKTMVTFSLPPATSTETSDSPPSITLNHCPPSLIPASTTNSSQIRFFPVQTSTGRWLFLVVELRIVLTIWYTWKYLC